MTMITTLQAPEFLRPGPSEPVIFEANQDRRLVGGDSDYADSMTAPLKQYCVAPYAIQLRDSFASSNLSEAATLVQRDTAFILGKDAGLQSPYSVLLRLFDELLEQGASHSLSAPAFPNVDAYLCYAGVHCSGGNDT